MCHSVDFQEGRLSYLRKERDDQEIFCRHVLTDRDNEYHVQAFGTSLPVVDIYKSTREKKQTELITPNGAPSV